MYVLFGNIFIICISCENILCVQYRNCALFWNTNHPLRRGTISTTFIRHSVNWNGWSSFSCAQCNDDHGDIMVATPLVKRWKIHFDSQTNKMTFRPSIFSTTSRWQSRWLHAGKLILSICIWTKSWLQIYFWVVFVGLYYNSHHFSAFWIISPVAANLSTKWNLFSPNAAAALQKADNKIFKV